jgi:hypothetical protein
MSDLVPLPRQPVPWPKAEWPRGELGAGYHGQRITLVPGLDRVVVRLGETPADASPNLNVWRKAVVDAFRGAR